MSAEQLLHDCEAITDDGITYAALILFGKREALGRLLSQSEIIFEYRSFNASGPANQREEFKVGFFACFNRLWELVNLRNDIQHYQEGFFIFDIPTFNESVVREVLRYTGTWKDLGTWNTLTEAMEENTVGDARLNEPVL